MKKALKQYVGRFVRLNKAAFEKIAQRAARSGEPVENVFVVGTTDRKMSKLICYGANMRIAVSLSDIVFL